MSGQVAPEYAVSPHDGVLDTLVLPEVNAETMSIFLDEVSQRHRDQYSDALGELGPFTILRIKGRAPGHSSLAITEHFQRLAVLPVRFFESWSCLWTTQMFTMSVSNRSSISENAGARLNTCA